MWADQNQNTYSQVTLTKRKPPLPSPFMTKHNNDVSHSKLALYSQNPVNKTKAEAQAFLAQQNDLSSGKQLQYNIKNQHQISQGHISTVNQMAQHEEEMRQTWGKLKSNQPRITSKLPAPFSGSLIKPKQDKSKKAFQQFRQQQQQKEETDNFYRDRIENAVASEEFNKMQNLLEPLDLDRERAALTKIEQYNSNNTAQNKLKKGNAINGLDPLSQMDNLNKFLLHPSEKRMLSQSSGFSTFDTYSLNAQPIVECRLDQMVTLAVFKSTSGTIKKMLHAPTLKIFCLKEVPLTNLEMRQILKDWIAKWEYTCTSDQFSRIHKAFWNSPEGCVSVIQDYAANGSMQNLLSSIGALPESTLKHLAQQILTCLDFMHEQNILHSNICSSQIVFDRNGKVKLSPGFGTILRSKSETVTTLNQHASLCALLQQGTDNGRNKQQLLKDKFQSLLKNTKNTEVSQRELSKLDLFDTGVLLFIAATGGLETITEDYIVQELLANLKQSCCLIHAITDHQPQNLQNTTSRTCLLSLKRIINRMSPLCQDFLCKCMQQRFSDQEMQKTTIKKVKRQSARDLLNHHWIVLNNSTQSGPKTKKSQFSQPTIADTVSVRLSLKELLKVSSDWKGINHNKNTAQGNDGELIHSEFQTKQIDRIVEAIALTLPSGGTIINSSFLGKGGGNTLSSANLELNGQMGQNTNQYHYDASCIKELAYDLGVESRHLRKQLQRLFNNTSSGNTNGNANRNSDIATGGQGGGNSRTSAHYESVLKIP